MQEYSQVLLRAPAVMAVHSECYETDYWNSQIFELLRPLQRSARNVGSSWDISAGQRKTSCAAETSAQELRETSWCILRAVVQEGDGGGGVHIHSYLLPSLLCPMYLSTVISQLGWRVVVGELSHLASSPGGGWGIFVHSYPRKSEQSNNKHQQWWLQFHNHNTFRVSYSSLVQSQDSVHRNMACIINVSFYISIHRWTQRQGVYGWETPG
jgi:hypothetical protein